MRYNFDSAFRALIVQASQSPASMARGWLQFEDLAAYIRIGKRFIATEQRYLDCVQLANLNIHKTKRQQKGTFTRMLGRIMILTDLPIFVESIHNQAFGDALLRRGFVLLNEEKNFDEEKNFGVRDMILFR